MLSKIFSGRTFFLGVMGDIAVFTLAIALLFYFIPENSSEGGNAASNARAGISSARVSVPVGLPVRLKIPRIKSDSKVEYVGLTAQGAMNAPKGPLEVGWFKLGSRPGEEGSAVIAGHYGWKNGIRAAFDNLYTLRKGDKVYVIDAKGATTTFVVRELRMYRESDDATDVFSSADGKVHLNLITCDGVWNAITKSYSDRLIVFTDKEL